MDELRAAWRRHRVRMGEIPASAIEVREAMADFRPASARDFVRRGYFEILVAAGSMILRREEHGVDPLPELLVASGAVS